MSVPVSKRGKSKFEVITLARELAVYTIGILSNERIFDPKYDKCIGDSIRQAAQNVHKMVWCANEIKLTNSNLAARKDLQNKAVSFCNELIVLISEAHQIYHLSSKRVAFWTEKTIETKNKIKAWMHSDQKRCYDDS